MVTLYNMLEWDKTLFDNIVLPPDISKDMTADLILEWYGPQDVTYDNPKIFKYYINRWFERKKYTIQKLWETLNFEYNPIENYNRLEETQEVNKDVENTTGSLTTDDTTNRVYDRNETGTQTDHTDRDTVTDNQVSPYNANTYVNDTKSTVNEGIDYTSNTTDTIKDTDNTDFMGQQDSKTDFTSDRDKVIKSHIHGNIGVTTTQQMIREEREIVQFDLYEWIAKEWAKTFIVQTWN